jgi:hypothetical protein
MKYGKQLSLSLSELPSLYAAISISYKRWKHLCQQKMEPVDYVKQLEKHCDLVNDFFKSLSNQIYNKKKYHMLPCSWSSMRTYQKDNGCSLVVAYKRLTSVPKLEFKDLVRFAEINNMTVYKVCKRIDKTTNNNEGRLWLLKVRENKEYDFMSGILLTRLRLDLANQVQECPICMESMGDGKNRSLILTCGHPICLTCVYKLTGIKNNGTLYNLLLCADYRSQCPLCVMRRPFRDISPLSFWEKNENKEL